MLNWIDRAWHAVTGRIDSTIAGWVHALVHGLYLFIGTIFGDVGEAWNDLVTDTRLFEAQLDGYLDSATRALSDIYKWINKEGYEVYYYITHPAKLVDLIWDSIISKLEANAWDVAGKLGGFFLSLFIRNLPKFVELIEDILDAVF